MRRAREPSLVFSGFIWFHSSYGPLWSLLGFTRVTRVILLVEFGVDFRGVWRYSRFQVVWRPPWLWRLQPASRLLFTQSCFSPGWEYRVREERPWTYPYPGKVGNMDNLFWNLMGVPAKQELVNHGFKKTEKLRSRLRESVNEEPCFCVKITKTVWQGKPECRRFDPVQANTFRSLPFCGVEEPRRTVSNMLYLVVQPVWNEVTQCCSNWPMLPAVHTVS